MGRGANRLLFEQMLCLGLIPTHGDQGALFSRQAYLRLVEFVVKKKRTTDSLEPLCD